MSILFIILIVIAVIVALLLLIPVGNLLHGSERNSKMISTTNAMSLLEETCIFK